MEQKKEKKKRYYIILILLLFIIVLSCGFALLATKVNIVGTSDIDKLTWDVHFENVQVSKGSVVATQIPSILGTTTIRYSVSLPIPGDFYEFTVDVKNGGTLSAKVDRAPVLLGVSAEQEAYVNYAITYSDGTLIKANDKLNSMEKKTLKIRIEYDKSVSPTQLPTTTQVLNLTYSINYIQGN